jgi:hypothetical protein
MKEGAPPHQLSRRQLLQAAGLGLLPGVPLVAAGSPDLIADAATPELPRAWSGAPRQIEGYANAHSVNVGQTITLHIRSLVARYDVHLWRMGWYDGAGGRLISSYLSLAGSAHTVPLPDARTGLVAATWPVSVEVLVGGDWKSGVYIAALHEAGKTAAATYIPFVVRNDASTAPIVHQLATATWQAYNNWGGKSLYDYNSSQYARAQQVSFDRPYSGESGAGEFFTGGDYDLIRFYEREGYDVTYITSADTELRASALAAPRKVFVTTWHDEYWSTKMRMNFEAALGRGMHALFLASNSIYWRIRLQPAADGREARTIVCGKNKYVDEETVLFRDPAVNAPENELLGGMYDDYFTYGTSAPWVVENATHWLYQGTGLRNGDQIPKLVGYEWDRTFAARSPAGLIRLSKSPVQGLLRGAGLHEATIYTRPSGAIVFNAATNYWAWTLSDDTWGIDERVRIMTRNLLRATAPTPPPPPPPTAAFHSVTATRILDTRTGPPLSAGSVRTADTALVASMPATGVAAIVCNVTLTNPSAWTYLLAYPNGTVRPEPASSVNAPAGATVANLVIVAPGADRKIALYNAFGTAHVIVDVVGWLPTDTISPLPATRILDTRPSAALTAGEIRRIPIAGRANVPTTGASCVVLNVTATDPTRSTYLLAAPSGATRQATASTVNAAQGATVANLAIVGIGSDGAISLSNAFGQTHVVLDVVGWAPASSVTAIDPVRILDTRNPDQPLGPDETRSLIMVGRAGIPSTATGVIVNLTLTDPTESTWVLAYPTGTARPLASSVNAPARSTVANLCVVAPGAAGAVDLYNAAGRAHLIVDVVGWFL